MFPPIQIFLLQTRRGTKRLVLQLVLLCAAVAFFVVILNLYHNSNCNLLTVDNTYTTIATMEIYGYVNEAGELVAPNDASCVGRHWMSVGNYDLSQLLGLDFVKGIDRRTRVGAYIPGHIPVVDVTDRHPLFHAPGYVQILGQENVLRFTLDTDKPMIMPIYEEEYNNFEIPIRVLDKLNPLLEYPDTFTLQVFEAEYFSTERMQNEIRSLNRSDRADQIVLYPDVEYVLAVKDGTVWKKDAETGVYSWYSDYGPYSRPEKAYQGIGLRLNGFSSYYDAPRFHYTEYGYYPDIADSVAETGHFALQRYEDIKDDPAWIEYVQAAMYTGQSFAVTLTEDIELIPAWYQGAMYFNEGRMITEEEYSSGAKVCMVSAQLAAYQGWQVGDKLEMHLYAYDGFFDETSVIQTNNNAPQNFLSQPEYLKDCGGFFDEGTYEIVGIYGQKDFGDFGEAAPAVYYNPWNAIYIPANAAPNAPKGPIQPSLLTIELKNGSIGAFKQAVEEMGLTDFEVGEYEIKFSCFDQGYSKIQSGLMEMNRNAKLLLGLSAVLLLVTMVLFAFLFSRQHKHSAGILRLLGGSKGQAFAAILACAAVVVAAGGVIGTILGGVLTQSVGTSILGDAESAAVELATGANAALTALSGLGCMVLFLALTAIFTATYIGKEPRALLPEDKG